MAEVLGRDQPVPASVVAVVERVLLAEGYVITTNPYVLSSITFCLVDGVWSELEPPAVGSKVLLENIRRHSLGLRAYKAMPAPEGQDR